MKRIALKYWFKMVNWGSMCGLVGMMAISNHPFKSADTVHRMDCAFECFLFAFSATNLVIAFAEGILNATAAK